MLIFLYKSQKRYTFAGSKLKFIITSFINKKMRTHIRKEVSSIAHQPAGSVEETRFEKIHNIVFSNSVTASISVAHEIADLIKKKQAEGKKMRIRLSHRLLP